jgi:hypothetical protein
MAISLSFGVLFSSVITLFIVPCGYLILEDLREASARTLEGVRRRRDRTTGWASTR